MKTYRLLPHPTTPPREVRAVTVDVWADPEEILLTFKVEGSEFMCRPKERTPGRRDELWKATCFELFLRPSGADAYFEFNFSPSSEWAAYRFNRYRDGMTNLTMRPDPHVEPGDPSDDFVIEADVALSDLPAGDFGMGLSAVIEEIDGTKSYWALCHPPGDAPNFHHPDCFAIQLPAASAP